MKSILKVFGIGLLRGIIFNIGKDTINDPTVENAIASGTFVCVFAVFFFVDFICEIIKGK